jgi:hypothetical protein
MTARLISIATLIVFLFNCATKNDIVEVNATNPLDIQRISETIEVDCQKISTLMEEYSADQIIVTDGKTNEILQTQFIDLNGDDIPDQLIFQSDFKPNESKHFHIQGTLEKINKPKTELRTFARFVPERIDDFAWENDKVAFRTYGPRAQEITESGEPGGTLSSGIDCWLKRVDYPIINKWYKQDLEEGISYHEDQGEGLDNYHVGASRGTGGIGIWMDGQLATSKNYKSWKIIANGPIRTIFELDYGTWQAGDLRVQETKRIAIDLGSNLYKCTLMIGNPEDLPNITIGITLHEKTGEVKIEKENGWSRYWEPYFDSEFSAGVVVDPAQIQEVIDHRVEEPDLSNLLVVCDPAEEVTYYAGFAWGKSEQFELPVGFDKYLSDFSKRLASPLKIRINP